MAEIFGAAAGGIGLAGVAFKLAKAVVKLKDLCEMLKDATSEVKRMVSDLERTSRMVELFTDFTPSPAGLDPILIQECTNACSRAVADIMAIADELQTNMSRKQLWTSFKMVIGKDKLQRMFLRLDRCKGDLEKAHALYTAAQMRMEMQDRCTSLLSVVHAQQNSIDRQCQIIVRLQAVNARYHDLASTDRSSELHHVQHRSYAKTKPISSYPVQNSPRHNLSGDRQQHRDGSKRRTRSTFESARWLWNYIARLWSNVWILSSRHAAYGWDESLQCGRVLKNKDTLWHPCINGDIPGVRRLLVEHKITIHDENEDGSNLFHLAVSRRQSRLAEWLWVSGCATNSVISPGLIPSLYTVDGELGAEGTFLQEVTETCAPIDDSTDDILAIWARPRTSWTINERLHALWCLASFRCDFDPVTELMPQGSPDEIENYRARAPSGATMLHLTARRWSTSFLGSQPTLHASHRWADLLKKYRKSGADPNIDWGHTHSKWRTHFSTALVLLVGFLTTDCTVKAPSEEEPTEHLKDWVTALHNVGVDLQQYGDVEAPHVAHMNRVMYHDTVSYMSYGPNPTDWKLWSQHRGDCYAGVFWNMVEYPEGAIGGARPKGKDSDGLAKEDWYNGQLSRRKQAQRSEGQLRHRRYHPVSLGWRL
ncbi:hypothetical protein LTR17_023905 [Elasticomyces elasticus]|nr:hypothetical protein LTR17_023905 [Elasticomyces elasticus]